MLDRYTKFTNQLVNRVNDTRGVGRRTRESMASRQQRQSFVDAVRLVGQQGLATGLMSEASLRLKTADYFLTTPPNSWFPAIDQNDLVVANQTQLLDGAALPERVAIHRQIYADYAWVNAVLICQPTAALVCLKQEIMPENIFENQKCNITLEPTITLSPQMDAHLQQGVGLIAVGDSLTSAIGCADLANRLCEIALQTKRED